MKNRFNFKKTFVLIGTMIVIASCSDYLDVNTTPNDPLADQVTPDLILPAAQVGLHSTQAVRMNQLGNVFMYNWGANVNAFTGGFAQEYSLTITNTFYDDLWENLFIDLGKIQAIIDSDFENYENHKAIAKIMKAYYYQFLIDLYGDLPYSEAFQRQENLTPAYDDAYTVYKDLIAELDSAQVLISNVTSETKLVGAEDVIFNGNMAKWSKFGNTVKLKMLTRLSSDPEFSSYVSQQFQSLQGVEFISEDVTINPGYSNDKPNPFYSTYGFDVNGNATGSHRFVRAGDYAVRYMNGTITGVIDPRLESYYVPLGTGVVGVLQGADDDSAPDDISELGTAYLISPDQDGIVMLAAESYFLQAEAVFKGYLSGNAQALFEQGITASFEYHGLASDAPTYIAQSSGVDEIGWNGSSNKIEAIMTQKWLATNSINAIEAYIDMTRTGFPEIPLALTAQKNKKPNRLLYPDSEQFGNAENVPNQVPADAFNTFIFWDPQG